MSSLSKKRNGPLFPRKKSWINLFNFPFRKTEINIPAVFAHLLTTGERTGETERRKERKEERKKEKKEGRNDKKERKTDCLKLWRDLALLLVYFPSYPYVFFSPVYFFEIYTVSLSLYLSLSLSLQAATSQTFICNFHGLNLVHVPLH